MEQLAQLVISGLATGSIYALAAMGFTLLWQASGTINFAQGEFVMLPAFIILAGMEWFGLPLYASFGLALLISGLLLGLAFKRMLVDPMIRHGVLPLIIATIALGIFLTEGVKTFYSAEAQPFPDLLPEGLFRMGGVVISFHDIGVMAVALVLIIALQLFLSRTMTGRAMQATAQNPETARVLGVNIERMILYTFVINAVLVTVAAMLVTPVYLAKFDNGASLGLIAFIAAIVGGFNQMRGALLGGLLIGVINNLTVAYLSAAYRDAIPLILLIVVILFKPEGLLGRREERTV
ncbi:MAG: branched-chain amino acid ABC transporter permease [Alphaproteobacteria bacterium]